MKWAPWWWRSLSIPSPPYSSPISDHLILIHTPMCNNNLRVQSCLAPRGRSAVLAGNTLAEFGMRWILSMALGWMSGLVLRRWWRFPCGNYCIDKVLVVPRAVLIRLLIAGLGGLCWDLACSAVFSHLEPMIPRNDPLFLVSVLIISLTSLSAWFWWAMHKTFVLLVDVHFFCFLLENLRLFR